MGHEKLGFSEFEDVLLDNISKVVINLNYIDNNISFWNEIVYKLYEEYYYSMEEISLRKMSKLLEIFLFNMIKHKPSNELPEDSLKI